MTLFVGFDAGKLYRPVLHISEFQGESRARDVTRSNPLLLMARLCIEQALADGLRTHEGQPTQDARNAVEWLSQDLDWTRKPGTPIPPPDARLEFVFSVCWCTLLLGLDVDDIRKHGLRRLSGFSHRTDIWLPGLDGIKRHWQKARKEYEEHMAQQPGEQRQGVMEVSV